MDPITVAVGETDFRFQVSHTDINEFLNAATGKDRIGPAHNLLMRTVDESQKSQLRALIRPDGEMHGVLIMQVAGVLVEEVSGDVQVTVKKSKPVPVA